MTRKVDAGASRRLHYGDTSGRAIARFSPVMEEVLGFAEQGGFVLGVCNGFQVLCESGFSPAPFWPTTTSASSARTSNLRLLQQSDHRGVEVEKTPPFPLHMVRSIPLMQEPSNGSKTMDKSSFAMPTKEKPRADQSEWFRSEHCRRL